MRRSSGTWTWQPGRRLARSLGRGSHDAVERALASALVLLQAVAMAALLAAVLLPSAMLGGALDSAAQQEQVDRWASNAKGFFAGERCGTAALHSRRHDHQARDRRAQSRLGGRNGRPDSVRALPLAQ